MVAVVTSPKGRSGGGKKNYLRKGENNQRHPWAVEIFDRATGPVGVVACRVSAVLYPKEKEG